MDREERLSDDDVLAHRHFQAAHQAHSDGAMAEALSRIDQAIRLAAEPKLASVYSAAKASFLNDAARYHEALQSCELALSACRNNWLAWIQMGIAHRHLRQYIDSANCFSQAVGIKPDYNIYTVLAGVQLQFDPLQATISANEALALNPEWEEAQAIREAAERLIEDGIEPYSS